LFKKLLIELSVELQKKNIPYMIIGGQALHLYGEPRLTKDIDITVGITKERKKDILHIAKKIKLKTLVNDIDDFVEKTMVIPLVQEKSGIRVDFIFSYTPYERQAIERARVVVIDKEKVFYASPEDVIIHKIFAGRERDIEDVRKILLKQKIDVEYVLYWLAEFDKSFDGGFMARFKSLMRK